MRNNFRLIAILAAAIVFSCAASLQAAAQSPAAANSAPRYQAGVEYNYLRTNAPPGNCPCFSGNGGDAWFGYNLTSNLGIVGEVASQHANNISGSGRNLTLLSYAAGPRYSYRNATRFVPFGEILVGGAYAGGSLAPQNSGVNGSSNAFTMITGGGLDVSVSKHVAIRAIRADYDLTTFTNGVNDHQNNLRISTGFVFSFK